MKGRRRPVVAIDGPAGAGKSTAARELAARLGFLLVDTGALYRGVALVADETGVPWADGVALGELASQLTLQFEADPDGTPRLLVNGVDRSRDIRSQRIAEGASHVSAQPEVRQALLALQRALGEQGGVVLEGRDIGTVVFPDAEVKVFLTASDETRAKRRHAELVQKGQPQPLASVMREIRMRDARDTSRDVAPLKPARDAHYVDTSDTDLTQVVDRLVALVRRHFTVPD